MQNGFLVLENGEVFRGKLLNKAGSDVSGECVFNTSMNGYQEIITDPSYAGQILAFTYPDIGNYGTGNYGFEAEKSVLKGLIIRNLSEVNGHYESRWSLKDFIVSQNITCLADIDTRKLTRMLRKEGSMGGVITDQVDSIKELMIKAKKGKELLNTDLVSQVSCKRPESMGQGRRIVLWDFGCKASIMKELLNRQCHLIKVPDSTTAEEILHLKPQGLVLSNGPGNPEACAGVIEEIRKLWGKVPMFGICLGHQLLALAAGASTYKMKFGHRGANHTVQDTRTGNCSITSQNHGYAVDESSLKGTGFMISFKNLNDHTVEGMLHQELPILSVQFHPESSPGPYDTHGLFDEFLRIAS